MYGNGAKCLSIHVHKQSRHAYVEVMSCGMGWREISLIHCWYDSICTLSSTYSRPNWKCCMWLIILRSLLFHSVSLKASPFSSVALLFHLCLSSHCNHPLWFASDISFDMSFVLITQKSPLPFPTLFLSTWPLPIFHGCPSMLVGF